MNFTLTKMVKEGMEREGIHVDVSYQQVEKENSVILDAISIRETGSNYDSLIYIDELATSVEEEADRIVDVYKHHKLHIRLDIYTYDQVRDKLRFKLSHKPIQDVIGYELLDMYVTVYIELDEGIVQVKHNMLPVWNVTRERVYADTAANMRKQVVREFSLGSFVGDETAPQVVMTNERSVYGAISFLFKDYKGTRFEDGFYVLPCSVHEVIAISVHDISEVDAKKELKPMVLHANSTVVEPIDYLSDHVYKYVDGQLEIFA